MTHGTFPRQPRAGNPDNAARVVAHTGPAHYGVEVLQTDATWFEVAQFAGGARARAMRDQLNTLFAKPAADLEFIHMTRRRITDGYAVVWPGVKWYQDDSVTTTVGGCPAGTVYTTSEALYKPSPLFTIATVTADDIAWYGLRAFRIAFLWANNVRFAVSGWNATKDAMPAPVAGGSVPVLPAASDWDFDPVRRAATYYGYGECQPNFTVANGEIFHTMDLLVAVPYSTRGRARWRRNQWVKVTYGRRSTRARLVDECGCEHLDLSRGLAAYLGFPGGGRVTVSRP
ncbi:MAG: RlpA-like double-psi beta-barrel domain-containing protein [Actinomycetota bacterium]|nr:RlpA-like double-psi beta-barrel domain-containing protein [Actinomycetota bacterium]